VRWAALLARLRALGYRVSAVGDVREIPGADAAGPKRVATRLKWQEAYDLLKGYREACLDPEELVDEPALPKRKDESAYLADKGYKYGPKMIGRIWAWGEKEDELREKG
jgi:hypothetical protein